MSAAREQCYERRDAYYRCAADAALAAAPAAAPSPSPSPSHSPSPPAAAQQCGAERALFEAGCPRAWVRYWDERVKRGQPLKTPGGS